MKQINMKVVSYCDIPEEIAQDSWLTELSPNTYTEFSIPSPEEQVEKKYDLDDLDTWIAEEYPELIGTTFLIEIDY